MLTNELKKEATRILEKRGDKILNLIEMKENANSNVFKIETEYDNLLIKIYPHSKLENRQSSRFKRETCFLEYLNAIKVSNTPKTIYKCEKGKFMIMNWMQGDNIRQIDGETLRAMANFTAICNTDANILKASKVKKAKDYWSKPAIIENDIIKRYKLLTNRPTRSMKESEIKELLKKVSIAERIEEEIKLFRENACKDYWGPEMVNMILSQSDMSINNIKREGKQFKFYDFEYAGWDDPAKLVSDVLSHPDHKITKEKEEKWIKELRTQEVFKDNGAEKRIRDSKQLTKIKWLLIMCNIYSDNRSKTWGIEKIVNYANEISK
ncbi:hypothetical protein [Synechococcus sp. HIMB2401]|uniref:hypothetical protein n=1 Tax=Synechococcus sp. HIMB2401 TaxID=3144208 RepID=UPI0036F21115